MAKETTTAAPWWRHIYIQVLAAIVLGVLVGHLWPAFGAGLKPLGDGFVKLVRMIIAPVISCPDVPRSHYSLRSTSIGRSSDLRRAARAGQMRACPRPGRYQRRTA